MPRPVEKVRSGEAAKFDAARHIRVSDDFEGFVSADLPPGMKECQGANALVEDPEANQYGYLPCHTPPPRKIRLFGNSLFS